MSGKFCLPVEINLVSRGWIVAFAMGCLLIPCVIIAIFLPLSLLPGTVAITLVIAWIECSRCRALKGKIALQVSPAGKWRLGDISNVADNVHYLDSFVLGKFALIRLKVAEKPVIVVALGTMQKSDNFHRLKLLLMNWMQDVDSLPKGR